MDYLLAFMLVILHSFAHCSAFLPIWITCRRLICSRFIISTRFRLLWTITLQVVSNNKYTEPELEQLWTAIHSHMFRNALYPVQDHGGSVIGTLDERQKYTLDRLLVHHKSS